MKCMILCDNTLSLPIKEVCDLLNTNFSAIKFHPGNTKLHFDSAYISFPDSYNKLSQNVIAECSNFDFSLLLTNIRYDNNYYFESSGSITILSFFGWNQITDLPMTNGLVYFIISMLYEQRGTGETHEENTGCINDFWADKTGVDVGMRAAFICQDCVREYTGDKKTLSEITTILDLVSHASRKGEDILRKFENSKLNEFFYHVFLCHNSRDKAQIRKINDFLKAHDINTWFDEEQIEPGDIWQAKLESQMGKIKMVCVFVGKSGRGPWQDAEIRVFLNEFLNRNCRIIPVILGDASSIPELPLFLRQHQWLDLRKNIDKNMVKLASTIKKHT